MKTRLLAVFVSSLAVLSAVSSSYGAMTGIRRYQKNVNSPATGNPFWYSAEYVDFASTSASSNRTWLTITLPSTPGVKVLQGQLVPGAGASGNQCYEIFTAKGAYGNQDAETVNADTRIWIYDPNRSPTDVSLSDDFGGTRYSKVRIWANSGSNILYRVAPFSSSYNDIDFFVVSQRLNYTTSTDCQGTGIPFVNTAVNPFTYSGTN